MGTFGRVALGLATCVVATSVASASPAGLGGVANQLRIAASSVMSTGRHVLPPMGATMFCLRYPAECVGEGEGEIALDAATLAVLDRVNRRVNASITPKPDTPGNDSWDLWRSEGDCDDYAVQKRHELRRAGLPSSALLLAVGILPSGEAHLVLVVRTDRGDYVLDNLVDTIRPWNRTGIRWVSMQTADDPKLWRVAGGAPRTAPTRPAIARAPSPAPAAAPAPFPVATPEPAPAPLAGPAPAVVAANLRPAFVEWPFDPTPFGAMTGH